MVRAALTDASYCQGKTRRGLCSNKRRERCRAVSRKRSRYGNRTDEAAQGAEVLHSRWAV